MDEVVVIDCKGRNFIEFFFKVLRGNLVFYVENNNIWEIFLHFYLENVLVFYFIENDIYVVNEFIVRKLV